MDSRRLNLAARAAILVGLSMVLVFGFWEHRSFYQYGLPTLLLGGGLATFLVILAFRLALSGQIPHRRPVDEISLPVSQVDGILRGTVELVICPAESCRIAAVGRLVRGRYEAGPDFGRLRVLDATRKRAVDLTDGEARRAGYRSAADFRAQGRSKPDGIVAILRIQPLGDAP